MKITRYFRTHPFSIMALCNVTGDLCYVGFAFASHGFVSIPKLLGASSAVMAHLVLLAYGDDQARHIAHETGGLAQVTLRLRKFAQVMLQNLPERLQHIFRAKPIGIPFIMLGMNGVGLLVDALVLHPATGFFWQIMLAIPMIIGCACFALADFVRQQKMANILLKIGPSSFLVCTLFNAGLGLTTGNVFLLVGWAVFQVANIAGFYTKIDKTQAI